MRITEFDHGLVLNTPTEGYVRSPGLHMSQIYGALYEELEPKRFKSTGGPDTVKMEIGTAFEETLELALAARLLGDRPGEFAALADAHVVPVGTPKSIIFSPDQFFYNGTTCGGEFKATWMSIRNGIEDKRFSKWFCQMMAYGKPLKMRQWRLYVLFVNGDYTYKPPHGGPHLRAWDVEFSQRELDDNWQMLMRFAKRKGFPI